MAQKLYVRTEDAALHLNSTTSTLEKMRVQGAGPPFIKIGRTVVYDIEDLDEWMAGKKRTSTSANG